MGRREVSQMIYIPGILYIIGSLCFIAGTVAAWFIR